MKSGFRSLVSVGRLSEDAPIYLMQNLVYPYHPDILEQIPITHFDTERNIMDEDNIDQIMPDIFSFARITY